MKLLDTPVLFRGRTVPVGKAIEVLRSEGISELAIALWLRQQWGLKK